MRPLYLSEEAIQKFMDAALAEDVGEGDHSTLGAIPTQLVARAKLLIKENCVLAGLEVAQKIFTRIDNHLKINFLKADGDEAQKGEIAFEIQGRAQSILTGERVVLNCMQRMSGIATVTRRLSKMIEHTQACLMDTRKTTPNFRLLEKWAVQIGGGMNHRFGLFDMVMLKDNHVDSAGSISIAVGQTRKYLLEKKKNLKIEVETRTLAEVKEALENNVNVIMLDNMSIDNMREAVKLVNNKCKLEASGGITESNLMAIAETGVDYISMGALTHSVKSIDLSLKVIQ